MAAGFEGISVENLGVQVITPQIGFVGLSVEKIDSQYFQPQFGMVGIIINETPERERLKKKTVKY